jgi:hypothetical protein
MALDLRPSSRVNFRRSHSTYSSANSDSSINSNGLDLSSLVPSTTPTSTVLVSNLPTLLFGQLHDLHPLFVPFGPVKELRVIENSPSGSTTALVVYATAVSAKDAKESLAGQCYANFRVETCYVRSSHLQDVPSCGFKASKNTFSDDPMEFGRHSLASGLVNAYYNAKTWQYLGGHTESRAKLDAIPSIHSSMQVGSALLSGGNSSGSREVWTFCSG